MTEKIRIGVLFGGRSGEHEVSLLSARSVLSVLDSQKYRVTQIGITHEGRWFSGLNVLEAFEHGNLEGLFPVTLRPEPGHQTLYAIRSSAAGEQIEPYADIDVYFPVLHGTFGEDGTLQGLFEMADVAYVGAGVLGSSVGMDKALFKDVMRAHQIPVVDSVILSRTQLEKDSDTIIKQVEQMSAYPVFVKPANMGSSVGISKCRNRSDLFEGMMDAARFDRRIMVEHGVNAREIEISVLGNDDPIVSVPGEILPSREFYNYEAKYIDDNSGLLIPAPLSQEQVTHVQQIALEAYKAADCSGMARVDFLLDKDTNEFYLNEINTIPGFTKISMYPKLWEASGISYPKLVDRLVELAFERKTGRDRTERTYRRAS
jgi:D-alanine-D-alanine ligase